MLAPNVFQTFDVNKEIVIFPVFLKQLVNFKRKLNPIKEDEVTLTN